MLLRNRFITQVLSSDWNGSSIGFGYGIVVLVERSGGAAVLRGKREKTGRQIASARKRIGARSETDLQTT